VSGLESRFDLDFHDQSVIDGLGKRQASALIDQLINFHQSRRTNKSLPFFLVGLLMLLLGLVGAMGSGGEHWTFPAGILMALTGLACILLGKSALSG
jgi:hypothetical protein